MGAYLILSDRFVILSYVNNVMIPKLGDAYVHPHKIGVISYKDLEVKEIITLFEDLVLKSTNILGHQGVVEVFPS